MLGTFKPKKFLLKLVIDEAFGWHLNANFWNSKYFMKLTLEHYEWSVHTNSLKAENHNAHLSNFSPPTIRKIRCQSLKDTNCTY